MLIQFRQAWRSTDGQAYAAGEEADLPPALARILAQRGIADMVTDEKRLRQPEQNRIRQPAENRAKGRKRRRSPK